MNSELEFDLKRLQRKYAEIAQEVKQVRRLIESIAREKRRESPWPSGRNLWGTLLWWLHSQFCHLQVIDGGPRDDDWIGNRNRRATDDEAYARRDECTARIKRVFETFTDEQWRREVEFWHDLEKTKPLQVWEIAEHHFADTIDMEWVYVKEDIATLGNGEQLREVTRNPAAPYRAIGN